MIEWIKQTQQEWGYFGVILFMFLENVLPPIPSELVMPLAGFMTEQGELQFFGVVLAGTVGSVAGALALYYLGYWLGQERICAWTRKYGKWIALSTDDLDKAERWFVEHGVKAVFFGRLVPGVRSLISIPAGFAHMRMGRFLAATALGTGLWAGALAYLGRVLGGNYEKVEKYLGPVGSIVGTGLAVWFVIWIWRRRRAAVYERPDLQSSQ